MLYMVVERFKPGAVAEVYRRAREQGRMLPEGLEYKASWVDLGFGVCYQVLEASDAALLDTWTSRWSDLVDFEVVAVRTSTEAAEIMRSTDEDGES